MSVVLSLGVNCGESNRHESVTIFAAASTAAAIDSVAHVYTSDGGIDVVPVYASSSTLARQIEEGAPADIVLLANVDWMNYLENAGVIDVQSRQDLLTNSLVLIAAEGRQTLPSSDITELAQQTDAKIAMGDPDHVPAGIYGRQALLSLGLWNDLAKRIVRAADTRAAVMLVESGEVPLGLVYASDVHLTNDVRIVMSFPDSLHERIRYPLAMTAKTRSVATAFYQFVSNEQASAIFRHFGFKLVQ